MGPENEFLPSTFRLEIDALVNVECRVFGSTHLPGRRVQGQVGDRKLPAARHGDTRVAGAGDDVRTRVRYHQSHLVEIRILGLRVPTGTIEMRNILAVDLDIERRKGCRLGMFIIDRCGPEPVVLFVRGIGLLGPFIVAIGNPEPDIAATVGNDGVLDLSQDALAVDRLGAAALAGENGILTLYTRLLVA